MREIKFRVWNSKKQTMENKSALAFDKTGVVLYDYEQLMQYTGLKDKNGIEIYEGDIVRTTSNELTGKWKHKIYKIEFKEINCLAGAKYMGFDFQFNVDEVEVIGNIYENKELLK